MQIHLTFALGEDIAFILWGQINCLLLLRETLVSKFVCSTNIFEKIAGALGLLWWSSG